MQRNPFKGAGGHTSKHGWNGQKAGPKWKNRRTVDLSRKEKEWGKVKFSPVVAQPATPWVKFKTELTQKQQEESGLSSSLNMKSEEAKQFLKKREENYRRLLIAETQKEATKWEDFSEEADQTDNVGKQSNKKWKRRAGGREPISEEPTKNKELITKELLNNFDSRKLTFDQNNTLRKAITKGTHLARGATLKSVVSDLKRRGLKGKRPKDTNKK